MGFDDEPQDPSLFKVEPTLLPLCNAVPLEEKKY